jgi:hypothetical protein
VHLHHVAAASRLVEAVNVLRHDLQALALARCCPLCCRQGVVAGVGLAARHHLAPVVVELWGGASSSGRCVG